MSYMLDSALGLHIICPKIGKSFITGMDTEIDSRYGKWLNPPAKGRRAYFFFSGRVTKRTTKKKKNSIS